MPKVRYPSNLEVTQRLLVIYAKEGSESCVCGFCRLARRVIKNTMYSEERGNGNQSNQHPQSASELAV